MPKQKRWEVKQDLEGVIANLARAGVKLSQLRDLYQPEHRGIAMLFEACSNFLYKIIEEVENIKNQI